MNAYFVLACCLRWPEIGFNGQEGNVTVWGNDRHCGMRHARRSQKSSYQKKDGRDDPSFGLAPTFRFFFYLWIFRSNFFLSKSRCHTKRMMDAAMRAHPSFGMTPTQAFRDLFTWHSPLSRLPGSWREMPSIVKPLYSWASSRGHGLFTVLQLL